MSIIDRQLHPGWHALGACVGETDLMFSDEPSDKARARGLCSTCPVRKPCLAEALLRREPEGIWGGLDENQRRMLMKQLPAERIRAL